MQTKQPILCSIFAVILAMVSATVVSGADLSLEEAIEQSGVKIAAELPKGSRVVIAAFETENDNLSDYIMEELTGALFDRGIEVADRRNLDYVYRELNFQMSGDVSDESAVSIGKFLGANMVITGQLLNLNDAYRYRVSAIHVEKATRASVIRLDVRGDAATQRRIAAIANQRTTVKTSKYGVSEDKTPQTAGTFLDRGIMFLARGDYNTAIEDFTNAIRLNPNLAYLYIARGGAYGVKGDWDRAIAEVTQATRLDPNDTYAYSVRGMAYSAKGDHERAIADCTQAIRLAPNNAHAYYSRGAAYGRKRDYDRCIADCTQAIRIDPNFAQAYYVRGLAYSSKDDYDRSIADYTQAIRLNPNYADAYSGRGLAYLSKSDYARAITDYEAALRIDPNDISAMMGLQFARFQLSGRR